MLVDALRVHNAHLEHALESRIVIEQAKGILAERFGLAVDEAFELLRRASRTNGLRIHELARRVVEEPVSPGEIEFQRARRAG